MSSGRPTILVVDDEPVSRTLIANLLQAEGYDVQSADTGKLALISVAANPPDLILLDVWMPGMDGFEVCRRIKDTEAGQRIPIMFISASHLMEDWVRGFALGAVDFISKPFRREELLARVRRHLELGRIPAQLELRVAQRTEELSNAIQQLQIEVAERRRAELAARESEARFRHIANAAPVIIWTSGPDNRVDFRNEYAQEFSGLTMQELFGDGWATLVHPDDLQSQRRRYSESMESRVPFQVEYRARRADGEYRWMLEVARPRFLTNSDFAGYAGIVIDYTEVKRSQERAFTTQNLQNLRVLTAGIAHDFNTLIGAIFGEADLALCDLPPESSVRDNIDRILGVAARSAEIVRLLLAYAGDRSDCANVEFVDLNTVVQEIVPHLRPSVLHRAEIRMSLARRLPSVLAKPLQLRQVVLNVIINAVEALDRKKGLVTICTSEQCIEAGSNEQLPAGRYVKLEVSDTGLGMSPEMLERIFDPYYSTKFLGRGLGLAAVQGIVRSYRGGITARSARSDGTTFEILLPANCAADEESTSGER